MRDLAGNAQEWTTTPGTNEGIRIVRGGGTLEEVGDAIVDYMAIENLRAESQGLFDIGMRCVIND